MYYKDFSYRRERATPAGMLWQNGLVGANNNDGDHDAGVLHGKEE